MTNVELDRDRVAAGTSRQQPWHVDQCRFRHLFPRYNQFAIVATTTCQQVGGRRAAFWRVSFGAAAAAAKRLTVKPIVGRQRAWRENGDAVDPVDAAGQVWLILTVIYDMFWDTKTKF